MGIRDSGSGKRQLCDNCFFFFFFFAPVVDESSRKLGSMAFYDGHFNADNG